MILYIYMKNKLNMNINLFGLSKLKYFFISLVFMPITFVIRRYVDGFIICLISIILVNCFYYLLALLIIKDPVLINMIKKVKSRIL